MYQLCLVREFTASHFLVGGDWGAENQPHAHDYRIEWRIGATELDHHGFLIDLVLLESALDQVIGQLRGRQLNQVPEFAGLNPSVERFSRLLSDRLLVFLDQADPPRRIKSNQVRLWENQSAWASWMEERS